MSLKFKIFRILSNGIAFAKDNDEKEEMQVNSIILYSLFALSVFFTALEFFLKLYHQVVINFIILISVFVSHNLVRNGFFFFSRIFFIQILIIHVFISNLYYFESKAFVYAYVITILNIPMAFKPKHFKLIIVFIVESVLLFFLQLVFSNHLPNIGIPSAKEVEIHKTITTIAVVVYLSSLLFLNVIINQYRESRLKKNKVKLFRIQKKLKSQSNDLQQFGVAITHSLKTPLILTNGFLDKIKNDLIQDNNNKQINHYFKIVRESNGLIEKYAEDLSAYNSIISSDKQFELFDIAQEIDKQIKLLNVRFENAVIKNKVTNTEIKSNRLLFEIVLQTLIENAIIYNDSSTPTLLINSEIENNKMNIYFQDNGIGINKEFRENIFLPFVRINKKINVKGSGLGLTSAKIACNKMGSEISLLESSPEGSTFRLELQQI